LSACYPLDNRLLLCLQCHLRRLSTPPTTTVTADAASSRPGTCCWDGLHGNDATWRPFVDVTVDEDACSSSCTTASDDVTGCSDELASIPGSDVNLPLVQAASVDSGHCSDVTVTDTMDAAGSDDDDDDSCDVIDPMNSVAESVLDLLADSSRVTDL